MQSDGLTMTATEFEKLPQKKQLTILYRNIVEERVLSERTSKNFRNTGWILKGLIASQAAQWAVLIMIVKHMIGS